jgi:hypothetical protein
MTRFVPLSFGLIVALGCGCSPAPHATASKFTLDHAGRPSTSQGGTQLGNDWWLLGSAPEDYAAQATVDASGAVAGELHSIAPPGGEFGTVMTCVDATAFRGQRLALAANVDTTAVARWAGLWMRVDGPNDTVSAFDNMQDRPIVGTSAAAPYQVVLDVDSAAVDVCYGLLLVDAGAAHVTGLATRIVDKSVPTTGGFGSGWGLAGSAPDRYQATFSFDSNGGAQGSLAARDGNVSSGEFGTIMTTIDAGADLGRTIHLRGNVAPTNVTGWAGLWVRIDDANGNTLAFDNMQDRPIVGTAPAAPFEVTLDVPADAADIAFGILLDGGGRVDFTALSLQ